MLGADSHHLSRLQSVLDQCSADRCTQYQMLPPRRQEKQVGMGGAPTVCTQRKKSNQDSDSPVQSKPSRDSTNLRVAWVMFTDGGEQAEHFTSHLAPVT